MPHLKQTHAGQNYYTVGTKWKIWEKFVKDTDEFFMMQQASVQRYLDLWVFFKLEETD